MVVEEEEEKEKVLVRGRVAGENTWSRWLGD